MCLIGKTTPKLGTFPLIYFAKKCLPKESGGNLRFFLFILFIFILSFEFCYFFFFCWGGGGGEGGYYPSNYQFHIYHCVKLDLNLKVLEMGPLRLVKVTFKRD